MQLDFEYLEKEKRGGGTRPTITKCYNDNWTKDLWTGDNWVKKLLVKKLMATFLFQNLT